MFKRTVLILASLALLVLATLWLLEPPPEAALAEAKPASQRSVTVMEVQSQPHHRSLHFTAEIRPLWQSKLVSQVTGEIIQLDKTLREGGSVNKGQLLLTLNPVPYELRLKEAQVRLAQANLNLAQAQSQVAAATKGWHMSGNKTQPNNPLVLRKPQLALAQAELQAALSGVKEAKDQLDNTKVVAPYDAIVAQRFVNLGESVQTGDSLVTLYNQGKRVLELPMTVSQWSQLPQQLENLPVEVSSLYEQAAWPAQVSRKAAHIDPKSRLRSLYLELEGPLPGQFVQVEVTGIQEPFTLIIPTTAYTPAGHIWLVDKYDRLVRWFPELLSSADERVILKSQEPGDFRIVKYPHNGLKVGELVRAKETEQHIACVTSKEGACQ